MRDLPNAPVFSIEDAAGNDLTLVHINGRLVFDRPAAMPTNLDPEKDGVLGEFLTRWSRHSLCPEADPIPDPGPIEPLDVPDSLPDPSPLARVDNQAGEWEFIEDINRLDSLSLRFTRIRGKETPFDYQVAVSREDPEGNNAHTIDITLPGDYMRGLGEFLVTEGYRLSAEEGGEAPPEPGTIIDPPRADYTRGRRAGDPTPEPGPIVPPPTRPSVPEPLRIPETTEELADFAYTLATAFETARNKVQDERLAEWNAKELEEQAKFSPDPEPYKADPFHFSVGPVGILEEWDAETGEYSWAIFTGDCAGMALTEHEIDTLLSLCPFSFDPPWNHMQIGRLKLSWAKDVGNHVWLRGEVPGQPDMAIKALDLNLLGRVWTRAFG